MQDPNRTAVLSFFDSLYASVIAFAVAILAGRLDKQPSTSLKDLLGFIFPIVIGVFWVIDDWICARLILQKHGYPINSGRASVRLGIDIAIMGLSFLLILVAAPFRPEWFFGIYTAIIGLGYVWARCIQIESGRKIVPNDEVQAIILSHGSPCLLLICLTGALVGFFYAPGVSSSTIHSTHRTAYWVAIFLPTGILLRYKFLFFTSNRRATNA